MEEMGTTPKQTWLFEDGAYSIETAKQLGIKTIGIYDPASEKRPGKKKKPNKHLHKKLDRTQNPT